MRLRKLAARIYSLELRLQRIELTKRILHAVRLHRRDLASFRRRRRERVPAIVEAHIYIHA